MLLIRSDLRRRIPLADNSVVAVATSPPFWKVRDYKEPGQIGLEETLDAYIGQLGAVGDELLRVLHPLGTLWLEIGDKRPNEGSGMWEGGGRTSLPKQDERAARKASNLKARDLAMVPARLALELQARGWHLRSEIIMRRANPQPETLVGMHYERQADGTEKLRRGSWRPTTAESRLLMFSKSMRYYADQYAALEHTSGGANARSEGTTPKSVNVHRRTGVKANAGWKAHHKGLVALRNPRNVWDWPCEAQTDIPEVIGADGQPIVHFAPWPLSLARRIISIATPERGLCSACSAPWLRVVERERVDHTGAGIAVGQYGQSELVRGAGANGKRHMEHNRWKHLDWRASCTCNAPPRQAIVLDPFGGSGTTGIAAAQLGRKAVLLDLSMDYIRLAQVRGRRDLGPSPAVMPAAQHQLALYP